MQIDNDIYKEIRPYNDDEVSGAIQRLIDDKDFINAILKYRFPHASGMFGWLLIPLIKRFLVKKWSGIKTVKDVQDQVAKYMNGTIEHSCDGVIYTGLDKLDPNQSYLFVSNHRDIAMDPAMVNWCLYQEKMGTVRIAIGDNLLKKPCATELMRLNKSFIVKRSAKGPRELMKSLGLLSSYISYSLETGNNIWIAQKEGRAKDGNDKTDPAILKMFYMEGRKRKQSFEDFMSGLNIVPVAISYENDPCDVAKAEELHQKATTGSYEKGEFEDIESIIQGIVGEKRRIHISFGDVITNAPETPEELALEIDRQITQNYHLFPANYIAAEMDSELVTEDEKSLFAKKFENHSDAVNDILKQMYALPALKKQQQ
ncbi:1-acyl-sn-glycerol-3-phosphate acyltransferase [Photobacterium leiognathi]|uniref:Acyltransferase family protein n=2 Tax=Photobacterium leiognathi TaxID=553611 RepID=V5F641_PHOLE|nr:1-acyl-sn-glycerol-3-phosphate acyltransferase [Photobacterium leiognathi]KJF91986.1 acyltransferase [Photobacterium leiognathi]KJF98822.1 acyltransferase [Photobacterium leiognathi]PSV86661.1 acyltransferase [Photobacterium leiognathi]PSV87816.1 acyltransferase [Photobacterium leiognathi]GAD31438.1 acyltransferase family protein [Photobacterium leiognathi lrivu.4.1]